MSLKNCSGIPSGSSFPKARSRAFCRPRGSFTRCGSARPSCSATTRRCGRPPQDTGHFPGRHPHHQSRRQRGSGQFRHALSCVAPRKRHPPQRGPRGNAPAELLRHDDAGHASGRRRDFRRLRTSSAACCGRCSKSSKPCRTSPRHRPAWSWKLRIRALARMACCSWRIAGSYPIRPRSNWRTLP